MVFSFIQFIIPIYHFLKGFTQKDKIYYSIKEDLLVFWYGTSLYLSFPFLSSWMWPGDYLSISIDCGRGLSLCLYIRRRPIVIRPNSACLCGLHFPRAPPVCHLNHTCDWELGGWVGRGKIKLRGRLSEIILDQRNSAQNLLRQYQTGTQLPVGLASPQRNG